MKKLLQHGPSPAMIVALIALFVALGGSSYAALKLGPGNFKRGAVNSRVVRDNALRSADMRDGDLTGRDVKDDGLNNSDIDNKTLQAASAGTAANAANADKLDGVDGASFTRGDCNTANGAVHGYARLTNVTSPTFSSSGIEDAYNCSGQSVEASTTGTGFYQIRFNGNPGRVAVATALQTNSVSPSNFNVSLANTSTGGFAAAVETNLGTLTSAPFAIVVF